MGMENYEMRFLHENCRIVYNEQNCWKVSGTSDLPVSQIRDLLKETCICQRTSWCDDGGVCRKKRILPAAIR